jgi:hypothetical protein
VKKFIHSVVLFSTVGLIPVIILTIGYIAFDPFKVLHDYDDFSGSFVDLNRDYVSSQFFLKNNENCHYDAFIFGSSRTLAYRTSTWLKYLPSSASPFMFDARGESVYGIYTKLKYLDEHNVPITNALILLDRDMSFDFTSDHIEFLGKKDPAISGDSRLLFQFAFFKTYFNPKFLLSYYLYKFTGKFYPFMTGYIHDIETSNVIHEKTPLTNEHAYAEAIERKLDEAPDAYYNVEKKSEFYDRGAETTASFPQIGLAHRKLLEGIKSILEKQQTNYKVVLHPLYEQVKFNPEDMKILQELFGKHLYDFSGKNDLTDKITNYYETKHFRKAVGDSILKRIYEN